MEQGKNSILRHAYSYMGQDLDKREKFLVLYTGGRITDEDEKAIVMTSQEAFADGWRLIVNGKWRTLDIVAREAFALDGKMSNLRYDDVHTIKIGPLERDVFLCRGCLFSAIGMDAPLWWQRRDRGDQLLSVLADGCIFVNEVPPKTLKYMLDNGVETALLRSGLRTVTGKEAAMDGMTVIDSYSAWAKNPRAVSWPDDDGAVNLLYLRDF